MPYRKPVRWFRRHDTAIQWFLLVAMLLVTIHLVEDSRHQTANLKQVVQRLDDRQTRLCVALRNGRIVFKQVLDALGEPATQVAVVDCPGVHAATSRQHGP